MPRYKLTLEYDGAPFVGWQRQDNGPSVQAALEEAVKRFCGETRVLQGAGRTDAGVHALGQVAHLDLEKEVSGDQLRAAVNHHLRPAPIAVLLAERVPEDFHARFSAVSRSYLYRILNRRAPPVLLRGKVCFVARPLDAEAMQQAAERLVGHHDFSAFRAAECQASSPLKTLDLLQVTRQGEEIRIKARARSFLHHQVRNMVGSLRLVGEGKRDAGWLGEVLAGRDRRRAGPTAPSEGLYLTAVDYP